MQHQCKLKFAALLSMLCLSAQAASTIPVVDQTNLKGLQAYVEEHLPAPLKAAIAERGLAVWTASNAFRLQSQGYCVAVAGLTRVSTDSRLPRIPNSTAGWVQNYQLNPGEWDSSECRVEAVRGAIGKLAETAPETIGDMQGTLATGGSLRNNQKVDTKRVSLASYGASNTTTAAVFQALHSYDLSAAVDYRQVETVLYTKTFTLGGKTICYARAGISALSPGLRQSRLPADASAGIYVGGDDATCERIAAVTAIETLFDQPWTAKGIFFGFDKTREDGVPLPDIAAVAKKRAAAVARAAAAEKRAATRVASTQPNVVRCSNSCTNGSCVRTFENGRKERWQAPRVYDAINNNWTWDITTNACGQ